MRLLWKLNFRRTNVRNLVMMALLLPYNSFFFFFYHGSTWEKLLDLMIYIFYEHNYLSSVNPSIIIICNPLILFSVLPSNLFGANLA